MWSLLLSLELNVFQHFICIFHTEREMLVQCPDGQTVSVLLYPIHCVNVLKEKLQLLTKLNVKWQQVSLDDVILEDDTQISQLGDDGYLNVLKLAEIPGKCHLKT